MRLIARGKVRQIEVRDLLEGDIGDLILRLEVGSFKVVRGPLVDIGGLIFRYSNGEMLSLRYIRWP